LYFHPTFLAVPRRTAEWGLPPVPVND